MAGVCALGSLLLEWRRDFAEQPVEFAGPAMARERDVAPFVQHVEAVRLQLRLHEPAHVCFNQDQRNFAPAVSRQLSEVVAKLRVIPVDYKIAAASG
jgi:hypothetical protein